MRQHQDYPRYLRVAFSISHSRRPHALVETAVTQYIFLNKGKGYVLSFSSEREGFQKYEDIFTAIANRLVLK